MAFCLLLRGPLGVGKSTVAQEVARRERAELLSVDRILEDRGLEEWDEDRISLRSFLRVNDVLVPVAREDLRDGTSVVIEGNFYWREQVHDLIARLEFPVLVVT